MNWTALTVEQFAGISHEMGDFTLNAEEFAVPYTLDPERTIVHPGRIAALARAGRQSALTLQTLDYTRPSEPYKVAPLTPHNEDNPFGRGQSQITLFTGHTDFTGGEKSASHGINNALQAGIREAARKHFIPKADSSSFGWRLCGTGIFMLFSVLSATLAYNSTGDPVLSTATALLTGPVVNFLTPGKEREYSFLAGFSLDRLAIVQIAGHGLVPLVTYRK